MPTIGSHENTGKSTSIGIAAHITAAAEGGPRYNSLITPDKRLDITNGIWLCSNWAALIDKNPDEFPVELLHEWKGGAEVESKLKLSREFRPDIKQTKNITTYNPILEVDFTGGGRTQAPRGMSMKNPTEIHDGQLVMVPGTQPIIHWALTWRYTLTIYNNSKDAAYNVRIENISEIELSEFEKLATINNIAPLDSKGFKVKFEDWVESDHTIPDEMMKPRFPQRFNDSLVLKLTYYDEARIAYILRSF
jgi:hypothetical protein